MIRLLPVLSSVAIGLVVVPLSAGERSPLAHLRDELPGYDPDFAARSAATSPAVEAESPSPFPGQAPRPRLRSIPPLKRVVEANQRSLEEAPARPAGAAATAEIVQLPEVNVDAKRLPSVALPRMPVTTPQKAVEMEPFLSPEAKAEKLVEKHLSAFDRLFLNRFQLLGSNQRRAKEVEDRENFARNLNEVADGIEQAGVWGATEEQKKQLRAQYYELMMNRPN